ncbi:BCD family MFS transporter [Chloroflexi bacterium TSY]|nr:BCD family MFS transporter [Chloroflexi bacterium TSY]
MTLVHVGVSITVVPVTSTLNRIMIADMQMSAFLVGILLALPHLLSPLQVFIGNWADRYPLWGRHRSPWIVIGGLMASFGGYFTAHAAYQLDQHFLSGLMFSIITFSIWGLGVNMASVSYLSLLSELSDDNQGWRSRTISIMWTAMILAIIFISTLLSRMLNPFSTTALFTAFGVVWLLASTLVLIGAANLEPSPAQIQRKRTNSTENPFSVYRLLTENHSARRFFGYLFLILVSLHAQDVLLEPYGAEIFDMDVSTTSRLTRIWGIGLLIMLGIGLPLIRHIGKKQSANIGATVAVAAFVLIISAGLWQIVPLFWGAVFLLGLGGGLMTVSNLSFMQDMTIPQATGLYIGAWGVANFAGQALGNAFSGLIRDVMYWATQSSLGQSKK